MKIPLRRGGASKSGLSQFFPMWYRYILDRAVEYPYDHPIQYSDCNLYIHIYLRLAFHPFLA